MPDCLGSPTFLTFFGSPITPARGGCCGRHCSMATGFGDPLPQPLPQTRLASQLRRIPNCLPAPHACPTTPFLLLAAHSKPASDLGTATDSEGLTFLRMPFRGVHCGCRVANFFSSRHPWSPNAIAPRSLGSAMASSYGATYSEGRRTPSSGGQQACALPACLWAVGRLGGYNLLPFHCEHAACHLVPALLLLPVYLHAPYSAAPPSCVRLMDVAFVLTCSSTLQPHYLLPSPGTAAALHAPLRFGFLPRTHRMPRLKNACATTLRSPAHT